jgi:hypothetical protein
MKKVLDHAPNKPGQRGSGVALNWVTPADEKIQNELEQQSKVLLFVTDDYY